MKVKTIINLIRIINQMEKIFPNENVYIINQKSYKGYNFMTNRKVKMKFVEVDDFGKEYSHFRDDENLDEESESDESIINN